MDFKVSNNLPISYLSRTTYMACLQICYLVPVSLASFQDTIVFKTSFDAHLSLVSCRKVILEEENWGKVSSTKKISTLPNCLFHYPLKNSLERIKQILAVLSVSAPVCVLAALFPIKLPPNCAWEGNRR